MMELSTPRFWEFSEKLEGILTEFVASLSSPPRTTAAATAASSTADDGVGNHARAPAAPQPTSSIPKSPSIQPERSVDGELLLVREECLTPAILEHIVHGDEIEPDDDVQTTYSPADEEEHDEDDDDADPDEVDFVDLSDVVAQHEALRYDQLDLCSFIDTSPSSLVTARPPVYHDFAGDSPQSSRVEAPRFPSLAEDETTLQIDALLADSDRDDDFHIASTVGGTFLEAVSAAVVASTQASVGNQVSMPPQLCLPDHEVAASEHAALSDANDSSGETRRVKRKAEDDCETPSEDSASATKSPRVDDGLLISKNLPTARRGTPKQRQQLGGGGDRVAAVVTRSECPLPVTEFVSVLQFSKFAEFSELVCGYPVLYTDSFFETRGVKVGRAKGPVPTVNFFIPLTVEERLCSAMNDAKAAEGVALLLEGGLDVDSPSVHGRGGVRFTAKIEGMAQEFDEGGLLALATASSTRLLHSRYRKDLDWIHNDRKWEKSRFAAPLPFLDALAKECDTGTSSADPLGVNGMREIIVARLGAYSLRTTLAVPVFTPAAGDVPVRRTPSVPLPEVLGRLCDNEWLNDTIVNFTLHLLASEFSDVTVVDSLTRESAVAPPAFLTLQRLIVFPVNIDNKHWCIICVEIDWKKRVATAYAYDPLGKGKYDEDLENAWASWCHPLLRDWLKRDQRRVLSVTNSPDISELPCISFQFAVVGTPKQQDGDNCGVYCIAQALCHVHEDFAMHDFATFSPSRLQVMRLRIMYAILTKTVARVDEDARRNAMEWKEAFRKYGEAVAQAPIESAGRRGLRSKRNPQQ